MGRYKYGKQEFKLITQKKSMGNLFCDHLCKLPYYFYKEIAVDDVKWTLDYVSGKNVDVKNHWSEIDFFQTKDVDIKNIWELSRFYWCPQLAFQFRTKHRIEFRQILDGLLTSWVRQNPYSIGPNWMCGQETAIRLINYILSQELLVDDSGIFSKKEFVISHCERISLTAYYAKGQKNNHALSEAIGLFIGGIYLKKCGYNDVCVSKYIAQGRRLLQWCIRHLILNDGTFSQYSVNYHRLALDLLTICFMLCHQWDIDVKSTWLVKYNLMVQWLECFVDTASGFAANIGSNDGAMLLNVDQTDYQDYSYSLMFAKTIQKNYYNDFDRGDVFTLFREMNKARLEQNHYNDTPRAYHFTDGGFVRFVQENSWAIFRYPKFKFRPSQCDIMHFDLWVRGVNVLLDSGTYSYHAVEEFKDYFKSVTAHNTVQIDNLEQMRSISRFLYLDWPRAKNIKCEKNKAGDIKSFSCSYKHFSGSTHCRKIELKERAWIVTDTLVGLKDRADLLWHMPLLEGELSGHTYQNEFITLTIDCNQPNLDVTLNECWVSKYYQHKERALVLRALCKNVQACQFVTTITVMK